MQGPRRRKTSMVIRPREGNHLNEAEYRWLKGALTRFPSAPGLVASLDPPIEGGAGACIACVPGASCAAQAAGSKWAGRGRQGSRDRGAPAPTACPSPTGQAASPSIFRPGVSIRRGATSAAGSRGAFPRDAEDAAAVAPGADPVEVGSLPKASRWQAAACGRATGADPAPRQREPEMGLHAHPGRASEARDQGLGHRDQKAARPPRPRASAAPGRQDLAAVPGPAGFDHGCVRLLHGRNRASSGSTCWCSSSSPPGASISPVARPTRMKPG
jgi:hypothetical protein